MRPIDTAALEGVARSLGVAAPGTATEQVLFDDEVLQQSLDVGRLTTYANARPFPTGDGWSLVSTDLAGLTGIGFYTTNFQPTTEALADGLEGVQPGDVFWIFDVGVRVQASVSLNDFDHYLVTLSPLRNFAGGSAQADLLLFSSGVGSLVQSQTSATVAQLVSTKLPRPVCCAPPSVIRPTMFLDAAAGTVTSACSLYGRFMPPGVMPPT